MSGRRGNGASIGSYGGISSLLIFLGIILKFPRRLKVDGQGTSASADLSNEDDKNNMAGASLSLSNERNGNETLNDEQD